MHARTPNYRLVLTDFNRKGWQNEYYNNMRTIDSVLSTILTVADFVGVWENSEDYTAGQKVVDGDTSIIYEALEDHTSATTGTFAEERADNEDLWYAWSLPARGRGQWVTGTAYAQGDFITDTSSGVVAVATAGHTSDVLADDITDGLWDVLATLTATPLATDAPPAIDSSSGSTGAQSLAARGDHTHAHGSLAGGSLHSPATTSVDGFMSAADKLALDTLVSAGAAVPASRAINTSAPLTGGGTLAGDLTLAITYATDADPGSITLAPQAEVDAQTVPDTAVSPYTLARRSPATLAPTSDDFVYYQDTGTGLEKKSTIFALAAAMGLVGVVQDFAGTAATVPSGWLLCYGQSLNRTTYASLFAVIGTTYGSADGSSFSLPDLRGRVTAGKDDMGGSAASRLTSGGSGITGTTLGNAGGTETHTLTGAQSGTAAHNHTASGTATTSANSVSVGGSDATTGGGSNANTVSAGGATVTITGVTVNNASAASASSAHQNTQPTMILNKIIFAGV